MFSTEQHNILSLIAATIFADKRVYESEIEVFGKATAKLKVLQETKPKHSEAEILVWYEMNKDDIRQKITTPYFKDWLYDLLEQLSYIQDKQSILDIMQKISLADGNVHVSERALTTLAKRYWGII